MNVVPQRIVDELRRIMDDRRIDMISISRGGKILASRSDNEEPKPATDRADIARWCAEQWSREADKRGYGDVWPDAGNVPADALERRIRECGTVDDFKTAYLDRLARAVEAYGRPFRGSGGFRPSLAWLLRNGWTLAAEKPFVEIPDPDDALPPDLRAAVKRMRANGHQKESLPPVNDKFSKIDDLFAGFEGVNDRTLSA